MTKLISFELLKKWKNFRGVFIGIIALQAVLLLVSKITFSDKFNIALGFTLLLYALTIMMMTCFPLIESMYCFNKDLSGKQSVFELSIPIISWKKVLAKLIVSVLYILILLLLAFVSLLIMSSIFTDSAQFGVLFSRVYSRIVSAPMEFITQLVLVIFNFASLLIVAYFCIALSKAISHKNKIAVPIGIALFIAYCVVYGLISEQIKKIPVVVFNIGGSNYSLTSIMFNVVIFALAFAGTSWLVEKKIES